MGSSDEELKSFKFGWGGHKTREEGMCLMETVAFLADEEHSWLPECTDITMARFAADLNDFCGKSDKGDALRQKYLNQFPYRLIGTVSEDVEIANQRFALAQQFRAALENYTKLANCDIQTDQTIVFFNEVKRGFSIGACPERWVEPIIQLACEYLNKMIELTEIKEPGTEQLARCMV